MNSLLSIIIPLYNKQDCILQTLESILFQEYKNYEIIIVDDGSSDNSLQVVQNVEDCRIKIFKKENGGPASARNYGVRMAHGEWIFFLDADDTIEKGALKHVESDITRHRFADVFCYSEYVIENNEPQLYPPKHSKGYVFFPFLKWYLEQIYPGPGRMVVKKSCLEKEPFNEQFRRWEDGDCIFRLMRKYRFYANPIPLFTYNRNNSEASKPCKNPSEDFCCNLQPQGKSLFEKIAQYKLYKEACAIYPESIEQLYGNTFKKPIITQTIHLIELYKKVRAKVCVFRFMK